MRPARDREWPDGFVPLKTSTAPAAHVGCTLVLAAPLLCIGCGLIGVSIFGPEGEGSTWVTPLVGTAFALPGAVLLYAGLRGARGLKFPAIEVATAGSTVLRPGSSLRLLVRQPGPIEIESLRLRAACERVYDRRIRPESATTVPDREVLWEQELADIRDVRVPSSGVLERHLDVALPANAPPTGPATPDGSIQWRLEAWGEVGVMRATYRAFDLLVSPATGSMDGPSGDGRARAPVCLFLFLGAGFFLCGIVFLWMFFSGAAFSGSGNPYMALFTGIAFTLVGVAALAVVVLSMLAPAAHRRARK